ncbi:MAG: hypothetical protein IZT58_17155 [Actinobacteria bacterium]|nr:hypothetical protein [Actinomycetota bacterium]
MSARRCSSLRISGLVFVSAMVWLGGVVVDAYDGDLDLGFGTGGVLGIAMGTGDAWGRGGTVQGDGMLLIAGVVERTSDDVGVTRVTPIGSLDTFGSGGRIYWDSGWGDDGGWDVAVQGDGKIVVAGTSRLESSNHLTVLRFDKDGTPDTAFGYNGYAVINFGVSSEGRAVAIQPDGKIVVAGNTATSEVAVARLDSAGVLDSTFGTGGIFVDDTSLPLRGARTIWDLDVVNGLIVVAGSIFVEAFPPILPDDITKAYLLAIDSDGQESVERSYDLGGDTEAHSVAVQPDGKILLAGVAEVGSSIVVARLSGLELDTTFSGDGIYTRDFGEGDDQGWDMVLQHDGRIIVAGSATVDGYVQAVVFRLSSNGSLDKFGPLSEGVPQGYNAFMFGIESCARSIAITNQAKLVVAGDAVAANARSVFFAAQLVLPSFEIFADDFESGGTTEWSLTVGNLE